jgi:hypothetical protein
MRAFCTYLLHTPWCRILFQKLIATQLVKKYPAFLWNPKVHYRVHKSSLLRSCQGISPGPRRFETFRNKLHFYGEGLLAPRPTPKLEGHRLSAVRDCLFNIFATTLLIWMPSVHLQPGDAPCRSDKGPT